ncbi:MAG: amidohydrolase family protein [Deltaproteobacteria bacterium]|nr:amidohydrolase family protein [Deltaproteobacteria bacterium]
MSAALHAIVGDFAVIEGHARADAGILCRDGAIVAAGTRAELAAAAAGAGAEVSWTHAAHRVLTPGTVNAHNHSFQSLLRGIADDRPFLEWRDQALYRWAPRLGAHGVEVGALLAFSEMLLHGVTTVCDFFYIQDGGNDNARAVLAAGRRLGMRTVLGRCFYDWDGAPAAFRETPAEARSRFLELVREVAGDALAFVLAAPHSLHGASPRMIRTAAEAADEAQTPLHIHLAEERYQVDDALTRFGARPLHVVDQLDALGPRTVAVHGCWFDQGERALLAERGAGLAYNPGSNMFLGDGVTDVVDLSARGVRIGLGTDGGCSNSRVSVFDEMRSCALLQKVQRLDGGAISAETCFAMGTRGGGELLGLPVGRLAPGYRADVVGLDLDDPSLWPRFDLVKNIVYALSARAIRDVWVEGRRVVEDGRLTTLDLGEIGARVRELTSSWRSAA